MISIPLMEKLVNHDMGWTDQGKIDDSLFEEKGIKVRDLMLYVSQRCNLRCAHCYVGNEWLAAAETFGKDESKIILNHFASLGLDRLTFLGGEPFLYPHITDLVLQSSEYPIKERRLTTNTVAMGHFDLRRLKGDELDHISVSLDGITSEVHESIRGKGVFAKTVGNIQRLLDRGFKVSGNFTVTGVNKHQAVGAVAFFKNLGITELNYHLVTMIGNAADNPHLYVSPTEWVNLRREIESVTGVDGIRLRIPLMYVTQDEYADLVKNKGYGQFQRRSYHSETGQRIVLYPNGKVYMSCDLTGSEYNFANFQGGRFIPAEGINELTVLEDRPDDPDPSSSLLDIDKEGFVRLSISYKEVLNL